MRPSEWLWTRLRGFRSRTPARPPADDPPRCHVILLDGTMSSLRRGEETNIGLMYRLLSELGPAARTSIYYEPGIQWRGLTRAPEVVAGIGINRQIRRAYTFLARSYRPGDRIYLFGFSRGAYAVRSLAGLIEKLGLLKPPFATDEAVERVYARYRDEPPTGAAPDPGDECQPPVPIHMIGAFDTVRALGTKWPLIWRVGVGRELFHDHVLGRNTLHGRQALAINETREAYAPVMWDVSSDRIDQVQQVWFRGTHGDIGGQLGGYGRARPLANIALVWMLSEAEALGLQMPSLWRGRYILDPNAPSVGLWRGYSKLFWLRVRRKIGRDPSERLHPSTGLGLRDFDRAWDLPLPNPA